MMETNRSDNLTSLLTAVFEETGISHGGQVTWRISGDILELSTTVAYHRDPDQYRQAVIKAGQLLQALEYYSVINGRNLMVQSFPNLEETRLIAIARLPEDRSLNREDAHSLLIDDNSIIVILKSVASHHGLFFNPATVNSGSVKDLQKLATGLPETESLSDYFSLCSTTDNPFIWLKTGQWIELVRQISALNSHVNLPEICDTIPLESRSRLSLYFEDCSFTQALVLLPDYVTRMME